MSEVSVIATYREVNDLTYVKTLAIDIPGYLINARLMHLDEKTTDSSYDIYVARNDDNMKHPVIVRDWTMRGFYQSRGDNSLARRNTSGGTIYTLGGTHKHRAKSNLVAAIFNALLGSCETGNLDEINQYKDAARAMYINDIVPVPITDQYRASIFTAYENLSAARVWYINTDDFVHAHTTWSRDIDGWTRMTHRNNDLTKTYRDIDQLFTAKVVKMAQASKSM